MRNKKNARLGGMSIDEAVEAIQGRGRVRGSSDAARRRTAGLWKAAEREGKRFGRGKRCTRSSRCGSLACPQCRDYELQNLVEKYGRLIHHQVAAGLCSVEFVTIVPPYGRVPRHELSPATFSLIKRKLRRQLKEALPGRAALVVIDISLNVVDGSRASSHWQFHAHAIIFNMSPAERKKLTAVLKRGIQEEKRKTARPLLGEGVYDATGCLSYCAKWELLRRAKRSGAGEYKPRGKPRLHINEELELSAHLQKYDAKKRIMKLGTPPWRVTDDV